MVLGRLPVALPVLVALGAIALIAFGTDHVRIAGMVLLGLSVSVVLIKRSPDPVDRRDDHERR